MTGGAIKTWWGALFALVLSACAPTVATETGNPSAVPGVDPADLEGMILPNDPMLPSPPTIAVRGRPGAVDPPEGTVVAWAAERPGPPTDTEVAMDGSFNAIVYAAPDEVVRLELLFPDGTRSLPADVVIDSMEVLSAAPVDAPCYAIEPSTEQLALSLSSGAERTVRLTNGCDFAVTRRPAATLSGMVAFEVFDDGPTELAPGGVATVRVRLSALAAVGEEDLLRVGLLSPTSDVRVVSLRVVQ